MKTSCIAVVICALVIPFASCAQDQGDRMDFELYDPPSSLVVPEHKLTRAKFPFIDVHNHQFGMPTANLNNLLAEMDKLNMAVMVNLSGRGGGGSDHLAGAINNAKKYNAKRFIVFTN